MAISILQFQGAACILLLSLSSIFTLHLQALIKKLSSIWHDFLDEMILLQIMKQAMNVDILFFSKLEKIILDRSGHTFISVMAINMENFSRLIQNLLWYIRKKISVDMKLNNTIPHENMLLFSVFGMVYFSSCYETLYFKKRLPTALAVFC